MIALGGGSGIFEILFFLIVFAAILFLAYITTRIVAKKSAIRMKSKYMEAVDRLDIGPDKQLYLIRVGEEHFLFSKSPKSLDVLTKVNIDTSNPEDGPDRTAGKPDFKSILEKHINFGIMKKDTKDSVLRKNIGKIRNMSESRVGSEDVDKEGENTTER